MLEYLIPSLDKLTKDSGYYCANADYLKLGSGNKMFAPTGRLNSVGLRLALSKLSRKYVMEISDLRPGKIYWRSRLFYVFLWPQY